MGTSIASLKLVVSALLSTKPWLRDPEVIPMPWRSELEHQTLVRASHEGKANGKLPLKLGILFNDGFMTPHPPIARGLRMIRDALVGAGHKVSILKVNILIQIRADRSRLWTGVPPRIEMLLISTCVLQRKGMSGCKLANVDAAALSPIRWRL
jgi:hypothetical protein